MRYFIVTLAFLSILTGCVQQRPVAESYTPPASSMPLSPPPSSGTPSSVPQQTEPVPTEPEPTEPFMITHEEVTKRLHGVFSFGKLLNQDVTYYWYPMVEPHEPEDYNFAEAVFVYNNIEYIARVKETPCRMSLVFEDLPWEEETKETDILPGITGTIRRCRVGKTLYTNILWYNAEQKCTYSLFWKGGREDYLKLAPIIFGYPGIEYIPG